MGKGVGAWLLISLLLASTASVAATPLAEPQVTPTEFAAPPSLGSVAVDGSVSDLPQRPQSMGGLDAALSRVAEAADAGSALAALDVARTARLRTSGGRVQVMLTVRSGELDAVRAAIARAGGEVTGVGNRNRYVQAFVPVGVLSRLGRDRGILSIGMPTQVQPTFGLQDTQGDTALGGPAWRKSGNIGLGVKVGIIDVGFSGYPALLGTDLPSSVTVRNFVDGESTAQANGTTPHGTACAEIVHDIAPGAQLFLAKVGTVVDIEEAADWLHAQGVDIISSSIGAYNVSPGDGTGYLEDIVAEKRAAGITWFTAAGNDRQAHWGGASNLDADGRQLFGSGMTVNWFGPGDGSADAIGSGFAFQVHVRWSDWTHPVDEDYDVHLLRWSGTRWEPMSSLGTQFGGFDEQTGALGQRPTETAVGITSGPATAYGWAVHRWAGSQPVQLEMFAPKFGRLHRGVEARSLSSLADVNSAVTVAALHVGNYEQEPYSSEGPTNGPGGSKAGGQAKPDIAAFANVNTVSYGSGAGRFNGTSAATPHVAGAAALVLQANPGLGPNSLESFLAARAIDQGTPGLDNRFGHGRLHLGSAPAGLDATGPTATAPNVDFRTGVMIGTNSTPVSLDVSFSAADPSGISRTRLEQKVGTASYANVDLATHTTFAATVNVGTSKTTLRSFRGRASDYALNIGAYATAGAFKVRPLQNGSSALVQSGSWSNHAKPKFYGGSASHASVAGRAVSLTAPLMDIALVSTRGPNRGIAKIFVDGVRVATIDLYNSTNQFRQVVWAHDFGAAATHTVLVQATGTKRLASTGSRVDFDAFLVMQP
jgi:subtilisin family serine protease